MQVEQVTRAAVHHVMLFVACLVVAGIESARAQSTPGDAIQAHVAWRYDTLSRCPDVRPAEVDDQPVAVVLFHVGTSGVPSQASIKASSGLPELDAAAQACVMKLRFQAATHMGDGTAMESWQQMAWKQAPRHAPAAVAPLPAAPVSAAAVAAAAVAGTAAASAANPSSAASAAQVHVCVNDAGKLAQEPKLTRGSGDADFDSAALRVARAASGSYRPAPKQAADCLLLSIAPATP